MGGLYRRAARVGWAGRWLRGWPSGGGGCPGRENQGRKAGLVGARPGGRQHMPWSGAREQRSRGERGEGEGL